MFRRFLNPAMANKNRIQPPSKIVHFFNTPPDLTEDTVNCVFVERGIEAPITVKLFPLKSERSSSGLIEFSSVGVAVAAIMECNHTALENSSECTNQHRDAFFCARWTAQLLSVAQLLFVNHIIFDKSPYYDGHTQILFTSFGTVLSQPLFCSKYIIFQITSQTLGCQ